MKLFRDIWLVFQRHMLLMIRTPMLVILGVAQPVVYLILFAPLLKEALATLGAQTTTDAYRMYVPGMLIALAMATGLYSGFSLLAELSSGVIERSRVTAISRTAMLLGRTLRDVVVIIIQSIILTILSIPLGLIVQVLNVLLAYLILAMVTLFTSAISYGIALKVSGPAVLGQVINNVAQPLMLLSGTLLPIALAPLWLRRVADWNPFAWAVDGMRSLFKGDSSNPHVWQSLVIVTVLTVIAMAWSTRLFAKHVK
ncbi:ABC transporter permease [Catelliglobosispora koreensis]|jgi:ABC-2 type transport system permease protein|uniref:ABC transporter permease n=1 Tax=Catelliglobosispora koreensis TaxID=129052 RepID=UPI00037ABB69|nr:ABC transporter permease [Catelliglobosispora koreensis]